MKFDVSKFARKEKFKSRRLDSCNTFLFIYIYKIKLSYLLIFVNYFLTIFLQVLFNAMNTITKGILILGGGQR